MYDIKKIEDQARVIRELTIESIGKVGVGHIGGALSICDLLSVLYFGVMNVDPDDPAKPDRDRLVLSKGHGGPALYAALAMKGFIPREELNTLNQPGTNLPSHCDMRRTRGIDMSTGSLGQGFSTAVGMAVAGKMDHNPCWIYTIVGDGECQEGQVWEAAMFAGTRRLDNLIAFVDYNKMQIDGYTEEVNGLEPLNHKWEAFNWQVQTVNGHKAEDILFAIDKAKKVRGRPSVIILDTIKGKGGYFCENLLTGHNMNIDEPMWRQAVDMLEKGEI